jgi:hypothetical protein
MAMFVLFLFVLSTSFFFILDYIYIGKRDTLSFTFEQTIENKASEVEREKK